MLDGKINVAFVIAQRFLDSSSNPVTSGITPTFTIYDQTTYTQQATGSLAHQINGIWKATSWTPINVGLYDILIDETTIPRHFYASILIGNSDDNTLATKIISLSNKGQDVILGAGGGQITYSNTLTFNAAPLASTEIRVFGASTFTASTGAKATVIDYTTAISKQSSNSLGAYTFYLNPGYYALEFVDPNDGLNVFYISWNSGTSTWTTSLTPINP